MPTTIHWDLNTDNTLGGNNPSDQEIASQKAIKTYTDNGLAEKQDLLTAGENIDISASVDYDVINGWEYDNYGQMTLYGLAYGNNKFLKMTNFGVVYESSDGTTWDYSSSSSIGGQDWQNLTYGYNLFVALGFYGAIAYSSSGSTWVVTNASDTGLGSNYWSGIAYGNNKYVVIGVTGYVSNSVNATTWATPVQNTDLGDNSWQSVTYFNGKFVAIGSQGYISESTDGINWTTATQNVNLGNNDWNVISHTNTQFFAISTHGYVSTSKDGENWSIATQNSVLAEPQQIWKRVACNNNIMIAATIYNYTCKAEPTNITLISATGGGSGTPTDVQINGTSITSNNVANILTNTAYDSSSNKIATMSDVPTVNNATLTITQGGTTKGTFTANASSNVTIDLESGGSAPSNMVTTNTTQNITGEKTFVGDKRIKFKQGSSSDKLGFTLYNTGSGSSSEVGGLELRPNAIGSNPLLALTSPIGGSSSSGTYLGFRFWSASKNVVVPLPNNIPSTIKSNTEIYFPLGIKNGSTYYKAGTDGVIDLTNLIGDIESALNTINSGSST